MIAISYEVILHQPAWLAEGLATYFEIFAVGTDESSVRVGIPRWDRLARLRRGNPLPAAQLFACERQRCKDSRFYATSWAVVSLLLARHRDQFIDYLQRLNELAHGRSATPRYPAVHDLPQDEQQRRVQDERAADAEVWDDAFPHLAPDELDSELWQWIIDGEHVLPTIQVTMAAGPASERTLSDADVLAARAWLGWKFGQSANAVRSDTKAALALDRTSVLAQLVEAAITHAIAPGDARATAAAHPDDWRALRLVELALHGTPEGDAALDRLCAMTAGGAPECGGRGHGSAPATGAGH